MDSVCQCSQFARYVVDSVIINENSSRFIYIRILIGGESSESSELTICSGAMASFIPKQVEELNEVGEQSDVHIIMEEIKKLHDKTEDAFKFVFSELETMKKEMKNLRGAQRHDTSFSFIQKKQDDDDASVSSLGSNNSTNSMTDAIFTGKAVRIRGCIGECKVFSKGNRLYSLRSDGKLKPLSDSQRVSMYDCNGN